MTGNAQKIQENGKKHESKKTQTGTEECKTTVRIKHINTAGKPLPQGIPVVVQDKDGNIRYGITDKNGVSTHTKVHCGEIIWSFYLPSLDMFKLKMKNNYNFMTGGHTLLSAKNTKTSEFARYDEPKHKTHLKITVGVNKNEVTATYTLIYLVIGFEVNFIDAGPHGSKDAYIDDTHYVLTDTGHAFFFTVKDDKVITFLSFGPTIQVERDKPRVLGKIDYPIGERSQLFKFAISPNQLEKIKTKAVTFNSTKQYYDIEKNDTCAETAKQILDEAGMKTPSAKGAVKVTTGNMIKDKIGEVKKYDGDYDNPYAWFTNIKKKYGDPLQFDNVGIKTNRPSLPGNYYHLYDKSSPSQWLLKEDTLLSSGEKKLVKIFLRYTNPPKLKELLLTHNINGDLR